MKFDFSGYATKNDLQCADGRIIRRDAFEDNDGTTVPLVWQHMHNDPNNVLGHALLENRDDGVYAYGVFNDTPQGKNAKELVEHGDVTAMSIYANHLKQQGNNVTHGLIREVSLVLAGANPGALIDPLSFQHDDGSYTESDEDAIIYTDESIKLEDKIEHADIIKNDAALDKAKEFVSPNPDKFDSLDNETVKDIFDSMTDEQKNVAYYLIAQVTSNGSVKHADDGDGNASSQQSDAKTVKDVWDTMSEKQKNVIYFIIGSILDDKNQNGSNDSEDAEDDETQHDDLGDDMHKNVFDDTDTGVQEISHDDMNAILQEAETTRSSSLKDTFLEHGITDIDVLFPEAKAVTPTPEMISRDMGWVNTVWNGFRKTPFARIKTMAADITADEARARGYVKGNKKAEEVIDLLKRETTPQTIYKLQKLDRDDIIDITDIDVVSWLKSEMRMMLNEELTRAAIVGDGRSASSPDKIKTANIRPVYGDDDLYTIYYPISYGKDDDANTRSATLIDAAIYARKDYRGSGNPVMLASTDVITQMLLARDKIGRRLYGTMAELASALRVSSIIEVPVMEGVQRTYTPTGSSTVKTMDLQALILNLNDYTIGADKGGAVNMFDDFDIDYNKYTYLIETRCSGALYKPKSAIALETEHVAESSSSTEA